MIEQDNMLEAPVELDLAELDEAAGGRKAGGTQQDYGASGDTNAIIAILIGM